MGFLAAEYGLVGRWFCGCCWRKQAWGSKLGLVFRAKASLHALRCRCSLPIKLHVRDGIVAEKAGMDSRGLSFVILIVNCHCDDDRPHAALKDQTSLATTVAATPQKLSLRCLGHWPGSLITQRSADRESPYPPPNALASGISRLRWAAKQVNPADASNPPTPRPPPSAPLLNIRHSAGRKQLVPKACPGDNFHQQSDGFPASTHVQSRRVLSLANARGACAASDTATRPNRPL